MKRNSIVAEYRNGNKWVRIGVWLLAAGFIFFVAGAGGLFYLWLTDFPSVGVPIPRWMFFCALASCVYLPSGAWCIALGMKPPGGSGRTKSKLATNVRAV